MVVLGLALAVLSPVATAGAETLTLVADEWCPYNCTPGDEKPGFLVEIVKKVFEPQGFTVDYKIVPWARAIRDTRAGRYSAILGAILTVGAASATVGQGIALLAIYSLGLGIPFLLAAIMVSWFGLQRRKWQQGESND